MGGSELPDGRRGHQLEVLRVWLESLRESGVRDYGFDEALTDPKIGALATLWYPVHFHHAVIDTVGRSRGLMNVMFARLFGSAVEMDAGGVLEELAGHG